MAGPGVGGPVLRFHVGVQPRSILGADRKPVGDNVTGVAGDPQPDRDCEHQGDERHRDSATPEFTPPVAEGVEPVRREDADRYEEHRVLIDPPVLERKDRNAQHDPRREPGLQPIPPAPERGERAVRRERERNGPARRGLGAAFDETPERPSRDVSHRRGDVQVGPANSLELTVRGEIRHHHANRECEPGQPPGTVRGEPPPPISTVTSKVGEQRKEHERDHDRNEHEFEAQRDSGRDPGPQEPSAAAIGGPGAHRTPQRHEQGYADQALDLAQLHGLGRRVVRTDHQERYRRADPLMIEPGAQGGGEEPSEREQRGEFEQVQCNFPVPHEGAARKVEGVDTRLFHIPEIAVEHVAAGELARAGRKQRLVSREWLHRNEQTERGDRDEREPDAPAKRGLGHSGDGTWRTRLGFARLCYLGDSTDMRIPGPSLSSVSRTAAALPAAVFAPARGIVASVARRALVDRSAARVELDFATDTDPGLFGPDSVTWRVHADRSMLIGGLRALFLQVLHPLTMAGVAQHSAYQHDPLGRLARTGRFVAATTYGTTAEAERAITMVRNVHQRVRGTAADGRPYDASDPALLAWVHNVEVESFLLAYRRYGPGLRDGDADRYVGEMAALGRRLGAVDVPESAAELTEWIDGHPETAMTKAARDTIRFLVFPSIPRPMLPTYGVIAAAAADLLPLRRRLTLGLWPVPLADPFLVRPTAAALLAVLGWALGPVPVPQARHRDQANNGEA